MEAYTLVIFWLVGSTLMEHRTRGLLEIECQRIAAGVKAPRQAKCVREEDPPLPGHSPGAPQVICPFAPPRAGSTAGPSKEPSRRVAVCNSWDVCGGRSVGRVGGPKFRAIGWG